MIDIDNHNSFEAITGMIEERLSQIEQVIEGMVPIVDSIIEGEQLAQQETVRDPDFEAEHRQLIEEERTKEIKNQPALARQEAVRNPAFEAEHTNLLDEEKDRAVRIRQASEAASMAYEDLGLSHDK